MTQVAQKQSIGNFLNFPATKNFLEETLQDKKGEFVSNLLALVSADDLLKECDPKELMMVAINATALNLPLNKNLGYAYVIPYKNKKKGTVEPQFQIGTKGFKQLAMRSGYYETMNNCVIRENELNFNKFTGEYSFGKENPEGKIVGYFAFFKLLNGYTKSLYMTVAEMEAHAVKYVPLYRTDKAKGTKLSKWITDERESMCLKTVIKLLLSREGMLSTDMAKAIDSDSDSDNRAKAVNSARDIEDAEVIKQESEPKTVKI